MRSLPAALAVLSLAGCMCRPGVIDCTTGRAYPGFCKPLCGGPGDPFMWVAGDCDCDCRCSLKCAYTPYGGLTVCGEDMMYTPGCVAPPHRWAPPAVPALATTHVVHAPAPYCPPAPPPAGTPGAPASDRFEPPVPPPTETRPETGPRILHDARNERPERLRR